MKKLFLSLILTFSALCAYSQNGLRLLSGDVSVFNEPITFNVTINDSNPIIDGKDQLAEDYYKNQSEKHYKDFITSLERAHESFITYYNEKKGDIKSSINNFSDAQYTLHIDVTSMNVGNGGGFAFGFTAKSGGAVLNGTMKLVDDSDNVLCEISFNGIKGMLNPKFTGRAISVYRYLADALINAITNN